MVTSTHGHKRILLHFLFGIGLPSLLLGVLAFRGIQNDIALLEEERYQRHKAIAHQITESVDDAISVLDRTFLDAIDHDRAGEAETNVRGLLEDLKDQQPLLQEIFWMDAGGEIRFPLAQVLYLTDRSTPSVATASPPSMLLSGQYYEFQQNRPDDALASYQRVLDKTPEPSNQCLALYAIARIHRKANRLTEAMQSYQRLADHYGQVPLANGLPSGPVAQFEIGMLSLAAKDDAGALKTFTRLLGGLVDSEWMLERSQYVFFAQQVKDTLQGILSRNASLQPQKRTLEDLVREERARIQATERLLAFQEHAAAQLLSRPLRKAENTAYLPRRFTIDIGEYSYHVSIPGHPAESANPSGRSWGFLLSDGRLASDLIASSVRREVGSEAIDWALTDKRGKQIVPSNRSSASTVTTQIGFVGDFPPWSLSLYQQVPPLIKTLFSSRRSLYVYMLILLAGILVFGLTLTIRVVTQALELGRMKSDFVSTVSHEFKSPLTSIRQLAEMLHAGRVPSETHRNRYYAVLLKQSERLSNLIDNILDLAKLDEGKKEFHFERIDVRSLLAEVVSTMQQQVQHQGFALQADFDPALPSIHADRVAIAQAVTNLIDNAVKYSGDAKRICVWARGESEHLTIAVQDFGIGIEREETQRVFDRFYRGGDTLTRAVKGSGLGLTLVKHIVQAHRGDITVESEPGRGSTFRIRLPLSLSEDSQNGADLDR